MTRAHPAIAIVFAGALLLSCADHEAEAEEALAQSWADRTEQVGDLIQLACRCAWQSEGFTDEQECIDFFALEDDPTRIRSCIYTGFDSLPEFQGDFLAYSECFTDSTRRFEGCMSSTGDTCTQQNIDGKVYCRDQANERYDSCDTLYASPNWRSAFNELGQTCMHHDR